MNVIYSGTGLGQVVRFYDDPRRPRGGDNYVPIPLHRHDDSIKHMRPDKNGTLEVVADCDVHFVRLSQDELRSATAVPCGVCL